MLKKKILIATYFFPPFDSIASKRWSEMSEYLSDKFDIYIFTMNSEGSLSSPFSEEKIKRVGFVENTKYNTQTAQVINSRSFKKKLNPLKGLRTLDSTTFSFYLRNRVEFKNFYKSLNPDILITSIGPFSTALFGLEAKIFNRNLPWIVDIRDSMSLYNKNEKNWIKRNIDSFIDKFVVRKSDMRLTVSNHLNELLSSFYGKRFITIYNGYSSQEIIKNPLKKNVIYYAGQVYKHQLPSLKLLLSVLDESNYKLIIRLVGTAEAKNDVLAAISEMNLSNNVDIRDPASKEVIFNEIGKAGNLLVLEDLFENSIISKGTLTGKLFDYLPYEGNILTICRKDSEIGDILKETGRGILISDANQLTTYLKNNRMNNSKKNVKKFSRMAQARRVADLILNLGNFKER